MSNALKVGEIQSGTRIDGVMLLSSSERRQDRNGNDYWQGELKGVDRQSVVARFFRPPESAFAIEPQSIVEVRGQADTFRDQLNLKLESIAAVPDAAAIEEFSPTSARDPQTMFAELNAYLEKLQESSPAIAAVCTSVLARGEVAGGITHWWAAQRRHHAFRGGLLEHILEMLALAETLCDLYQELDRDLVLAGCILHDLGKLVELAPRGPEYGYSAAGSLVGHIAICDRWVAEACAEADAGEELTMRLRHLVLSHHGEQAMGAVVEPATPEAMALHLLDYLSSQLRQAVDAVDELGSPGAVNAEGMANRRDWRFQRFWYRGEGQAE